MLPKWLVDGRFHVGCGGPGRWELESKPAPHSPHSSNPVTMEGVAGPNLSEWHFNLCTTMPRARSWAQPHRVKCGASSLSKPPASEPSLRPGIRVVVPGQKVLLWEIGASLVGQGGGSGEGCWPIIPKKIWTLGGITKKKKIQLVGHFTKKFMNHCTKQLL